MTAEEVVAVADSDEPVSERVVDAVAIALNADPTALSMPLYYAVEPDALDELFPTSGDSNARVEFTYEGCAVTVETGGDVTVEPRTEILVND